MAECINCKKRPGILTCDANFVFYICGHADCRNLYNNETIGEILAREGEHGMWYFIENEVLNIKIGRKNHRFPADKRIIKGLHNKLQELMKNLEPEDDQTNN